MNTPEENDQGADTTAEQEVESEITPALVDRVSERLALGIPLRLALAGEAVTCEDYEEHLGEHPDLAELQDVARRRFLENALGVMLKGKDAAANFRWLIERVYVDVIGSPREEEPKKKFQTLLGVPEEEVNRLRRMAPTAAPNASPYE